MPYRFFFCFVRLYAVQKLLLLTTLKTKKIIKKLIMLSIVGIFTLSSFSVSISNLKKTNIQLQTWYYSCGDGTGGTFLMPQGSSHDQAMEIATALCR